MVTHDRDHGSRRPALPGAMPQSQPEETSDLMSCCRSLVSPGCDCGTAEGRREPWSLHL